MRFLYSQYHYKMPLFLVKKLVGLKYDSDKFADWYMKLPDLSEGYKSITDLRSRKPTFYWMSGYYCWGLYLVACMTISTLNPLIAVFGAIISPFIVFGYIYALANSEKWLKKFKFQRKIKK